MTQPLLGIDIGSTTVKLVLLEPAARKVVYHRYGPPRSAAAGDDDTPSEGPAGGGRQYSGTAHLYRQRCKWYRPLLRAAPRSGGRGKQRRRAPTSIPTPGLPLSWADRDAKVIFFRLDEATGELHASDMRMNGSCAGGTGAFIDEVAKLLQTPVEQFDDLAARGASGIPDFRPLRCFCQDRHTAAFESGGGPAPISPCQPFTPSRGRR